VRRNPRERESDLYARPSSLTRREAQRAAEALDPTLHVPDAAPLRGPRQDPRAVVFDRRLEPAVDHAEPHVYVLGGSVLESVVDGLLNDARESEATGRRQRAGLPRCARREFD